MSDGKTIVQGESGPFRQLSQNTPSRKPDGATKSPQVKRSQPAAPMLDELDKENCWVDANEYLNSNLGAIAEEAPEAADQPSSLKPRAGGPLVDYNSKRMSFATRRTSVTGNDVMNKLHSEFDVLQAKLAALKNSNKPEAGEAAAERRATYMPPPIKPLLAPTIESLDRRASALPGALKPQLSQMDVLDLLPHAAGPQDSALKALGPAGDKEKIFSLPDSAASSRAGKCALELFEEEELQKMCRQGLHAQLTRTNAGATDATRIQELAGGPAGPAAHLHCFRFCLLPHTRALTTPCCCCVFVPQPW